MVPKPDSPLLAVPIALVGFACGFLLVRDTPSGLVRPPPSFATTPGEISLQTAIAGSKRLQMKWLANHGLTPSPAMLTELIHAGKKRAFCELLTLWGSRDPKAALAYTLGLNRAILNDAFTALAEGWARHDCESLVAWLASEDEAAALSLFRRKALAAIARSDPGLAFSLLQSDAHHDPIELYRALFTTLGMNNPREALLMLHRVPEEYRVQATLALLREWSSVAPAAALSWIHTLPNHLRSSAMNAFVTALGERGAYKEGLAMLAAEVVAGRIRHATELSSLLRDLLFSGETAKATEVKQWIATLPKEMQKAALHGWRESLAEKRPMDLLQELEEEKTVRYPDPSLQRAFSSLVTANPAQAASWIRGNREWLPQLVLRDLVSALLRESPELSPQFLPQLSKGTMQNYTYQEAGKAWAKKDTPQAMAYLETLPHDRDRDSFYFGIFDHIVQTDLEETFRQVEAQAPGKMRSHLFTKLALQTTNLPLTIDWIFSRYGHEQDSTQGLYSAVDRWAKTAPAETAEWLAKVEPGPARDDMVQLFVSHLFDPAIAIEWAATIEDEFLQRETIIDVAQRWLKQDPEGAHVWIRQAPFTDEEKARLLKN